jgi:hypothetical protein
VTGKLLNPINICFNFKSRKEPEHATSPSQRLKTMEFTQEFLVKVWLMPNLCQRQLKTVVYHGDMKAGG